MFLHLVNNIEHNIKQNIYTEMGLISLMPPCHGTVYKNSKNKNVLINNINNKIYFSNNTVIICQWICGHIYITNGQNKQTLYIYNFFQIMHSFPEIVAEVVRKQTSNVEVYYIIPLNYRLTGHPKNFKIELYYF